MRRPLKHRRGGHPDLRVGKAQAIIEIVWKERAKSAVNFEGRGTIIDEIAITAFDGEAILAREARREIRAFFSSS